jgi:NAD(P)H-dependent FMN reductase
VSEFLVISCSLNPESNSRILCKTAFEHIKKEHSAELIDLRDLNLPLCDGASAYGHPAVAPIGQKIRDAKCILLGVPVYNYYVNAAAKNLIELTGKAWTDKVVGFLCAAGGRSSYMSVMSLGNSLMLDFRSMIIPRFVYATDESFDDTSVTDAELHKRIEELSQTASRLTYAIHRP